MYFPIFHWLPEPFKNRTGKLRQLIQKKYSVMSQRNFSRSGYGATSRETSHGYGMMRTPEWSFPYDMFSLKQTSHTVNLSYFQRFFPVHRRKYGSNTAGQHGLPGPGRTYHQQVMSPCRSNFHGPLGQLLPLYFRKINRISHGLLFFPSYLRMQCSVFQHRLHQFTQCLWCKYLDLFTQQGFRCTAGRHNEYGKSCLPCRQYHG